VFLALAIGIVLGSTELQGHTIDALNATSNLLSSELKAAQAQSDAYQKQVSASEQFLQTSEPRLLGGLLTGDKLVIVTEPGAQSSVADGIKQAAGIAGATVTGEVALQPKFYDVSGANESSLSSINNSIASPDGILLDSPANPQTADQQQAAQLIAAAIMDKSDTQPGGLPTATAQALLSGYAQAGYLTVSGTVTDRATLAVIVTPQSAPSDGANDPANQVLLAIAQEFATASAVSLVAGNTTGSAQAGSAMSVLRSSSVSSSVSSVDNADTTLGQIVVVQAIAAQLAGGKPNSYGMSGASAVSPSSVPSPTPSATVTLTPSSSPHPRTTGKATSPVKKK
jgi:Copper transport outer membrane protein, MctB